MALGIDDGLHRPLGADHVAVLAAQADRPAALGRDPADDLLVDQAGQDHLDHLDGGLVGDAQAAAELGLDAEPVEHPADLRSAAVHDDRLQPGLLQKDDVLGEVLGGGPVAHGVAAILDHHDFLVVALHVGQRLGQDLGAHVHVRQFGHRGPSPILGSGPRGRICGLPVGRWRFYRKPPALRSRARARIGTRRRGAASGRRGIAGPRPRCQKTVTLSGCCIAGDRLEAIQGWPGLHRRTARIMLHCNKPQGGLPGGPDADRDDWGRICRPGLRSVPGRFRPQRGLHRPRPGQDRQPERRPHADLRAGPRRPGRRERPPGPARLPVAHARRPWPRPTRCSSRWARRPAAATASPT